MDCEIFEALVRSVLSNSTDWSKVERVLPALQDCFHGFDARWYSQLAVDEVRTAVVPWFKDRRAGSMTLAGDLCQLVNAAKRLCSISESMGSFENYLAELHLRNQRDPKRMAVALGSSKGTDKLPTLGIPLAAEFLKNVGFDVAKPDRHVNRAVGSFGWVNFARWPDREQTKPPTPTEAELLAVMGVMEDFAVAVKQPVAFVDNAVWLICARSGLRLTNRELSALPGPSTDAVR